MIFCDIIQATYFQICVCPCAAILLDKNGGLFLTTDLPVYVGE